MPKENTGIIVVDMQKNILKEFEKQEVKNLQRAYRKLLKYAQENQIKIYNCIAPGFGGTIETINKYQTIPTFEKKKKTNSCFTAPRLLETLIQNGEDNLIITGICGPYCVEATAKSALEKGFNIVSSEDLIAAQKKDQEKNNEFMSWFYRESQGKFFDNTDELIDYLKS